MNKLYKNGKVHPSSPSPPRKAATISERLLALLPTTILTLTIDLSPQDQEVLAYLISSFDNKYTNTSTITCTNTDDDGKKFDCHCFSCYMAYWARWDTSPNRQLIHEIIDAYEDYNHRIMLDSKKKKMKKKKQRKMKRIPAVKIEESRGVEAPDYVGGDGGGGGEMGVVSKIVSFIGEKIWGARSQA